MIIFKAALLEFESALRYTIRSLKTSSLSAQCHMATVDPSSLLLASFTGVSTQMLTLICERILIEALLFRMS